MPARLGADRRRSWSRRCGASRGWTASGMRHVLLRPGVASRRTSHPLLGPAPELARLLRGRDELPRHPVRRAAPAASWRSGSWTASRRSTSRTTRSTGRCRTRRPARFRQERTVELARRAVRRRASGRRAARRRTRRTTLGAARQAGRGRRAIRPSGGLGGARSGSRAPGVSTRARADVGSHQAFDATAAEHRAVREAVGVMDMSLMAKLPRAGPGRAALLNRLSVSQVDGPSGRSSTRSGATPRAASGPT